MPLPERLSLLFVVALTIFQTLSSLWRRFRKWGTINTIRVNLSIGRRKNQPTKQMRCCDIS